MTTNELLTQMEEAAFAPFYQEEIKAIFDHDVSSGKFESETRDYTNAMKHLSIKLEADPHRGRLREHLPADPGVLCTVRFHCRCLLWLQAALHSRPCD